MSVTLIRVSSPGKEGNVEEHNDLEIPVSLPLVLGRGALLKCAEKKVSRRHAYLDWDNDGVQITSVHQNPTYIMVSGREEELTEGSSTLLCHGDMFGLLKTNFWFKINMPSVISKDEHKSKAADVTTNNNVPVGCADQVEHMENDSENKIPGQTRNKAVDLHNNKDNEAVNTKIEDSRDKVHGKASKPDAVTEGSNTAKDKILQQDTVRDTNDINKEKESKRPKEVEHQKALNNEKEWNSDNECCVAATTMTVQEVQSAVTQRKRNLPGWMVKCGVPENKQVAPATPGTNVHSHGGSRRKQTWPTTKRKRTDKAGEGSGESLTSPQVSSKPHSMNLSSTGSAVKGSDAGEASDAESPKMQQNEKASHETPKVRNSQHNSRTQKAKRSPSKKVAAPQKPGAKVLHSMSGDSSGDEADVQEAASESPEKAANRITPPVQQSRSPVKKTSPRKQRQDFSESEEEESATTKTANGAVSTTANASLPSISGNSTPTSTATTTTTTTTVGAASPRKGPRPSCQYGASCYRKNPQHRVAFAHAGDPDYKEDASDPDEASDDDRPQCEYGVQCYRKNPQHRRDYRHTRIPQPRRRVKRKARQQGDNSGSGSDDYDYDDTFINDGSSDDYAPSDSSSESLGYVTPDDDEEEKLKEKLKAQLKRKKRTK